MRFILPTILLLLSVGLFIEYTNPAYQSLTAERALATKYDTALTNARKLSEQRDALNEKYRKISPDDLARLSKLLPDNADNIRLTIDIQQMAQSYGMSITAIKFDSTSDAPASAGAGQLAAVTAAAAAQASKAYGIFNMQFSTTASYSNFQSFLKDIESSLRLTDVQSIEFSAPDQKGLITYTVKLRTYWLKG